MPSFTSSSERLTAADRPGVAQPVPVRDIPQKPWRAIFAVSMILTLVLVGLWEWRMRSLELLPGDLDDGASAWAEQRRRIDTEDVQVAIVGDSRILFDTDLNRFQALTGIRPVQLALPGTNGRPFLENLAEDPHFHGLAIVGIAETSYFREGIGLQKDALARYHYESPSQRVSFILHRALSRVFGFLDEDYRLSTLVQQLDPDWRPGAKGPYDEVWKISSSIDDRQTYLWPRIEEDERLRLHARAVWGLIFSGPPVTDAVIKMTLEKTRAAVAEIRAHGGDVVFVRPPSAPELRVTEEKRLPRARGWDSLLKTAKVKGIHFDDFASMRGLVLPEFSHLRRTCSTVFTDAYVRVLAGITNRIHLRPGSPQPLVPKDCAQYARLQRPQPGSLSIR